MDSIKRFFFGSPSAKDLYDKAELFYRSYQLNQKPEDLKKAIDNYKAAVAARRKKGKSDEAHVLAGYAMALWTRYEQDPGRSEDLIRNIQLNEGAYAQWSTENPKPEGYPDLLLNLANAHYKKAGVSGSESDAGQALTKSISFLDELNFGCYATTRTETKVNGLVLLGAALHRLCNAQKTTTRLDDAIKWLKEALNILEKIAPVEETGEHRHGQEEIFGAARILCYANLAEAYDVRFKYHLPANSQDLDFAIAYSKRVIAILPPNHPDRGTSLFNLAYQLYRRYNRAREGEKDKGRLVTNDMNRQESVQDLKDAYEAVLEAQRLLEGTGYSESVRKLSEVLKAHMDDLSRPSSRNTNRATTPIGGEKLPSRKNRNGKPNA